jgi:tetratricopeptide (TPR) repeat protein
MEDLHKLLFEKGRVGKVLAALSTPALPDPVADPCRALLYGHALCLYGDFQQAVTVYTAIPSNPAYEAERLWGLANAQFHLGNLKQVKPLVDEAMSKDPCAWLLPRLYNTLVNLYIYQGQFEQAQGAIEKGLQAAQRGPHLTEQLILDGNRGVVKVYEGRFEDAVFLLGKAVKQLLVRDCILSAATFLINLSGTYEALGARGEAQKCLSQAEGLIQESGSKARLIFLRQTQGELWERTGPLARAEEAYREALGLLQELPNPKLEVQLTCDLAHLHYEKGNLGEALRLIHQACSQVEEKGLVSLRDLCLGYEGKFLLRAGATREGFVCLDQARQLAESLGKWSIYCYITLYLAQCHEELRQRKEALQWLKKSLEVAERCHMLSALLVEKDLIIALLLKLGEAMPPTEFLSKLIVKLRHPALLKRLLKHSPQGKVLFLRSLSVRDARQYRPQLAKLRNHPEKEVRRTSRLLLNGWNHQTNYRIYALGGLRVFLEGKLFLDNDWILPGVKRLFIYFATHPEEWQSTDHLLETLWKKPHPQKTRKVLKVLFFYLRSVFEPWHLPGDEYVFFKSQRGAYGFFPGERFWMDWKEFEEGIKRAEKAHLARNFKEARKAYREALDFYLGDYLEEFPYEDWLNPKRDYLRELYFRGVMRYATIERDSGNLPEARRVLEEALFRDMSRSGCAALLMQVLVQMKLSQEAREWGQRHITYMKKELKEKPAPEVMEALAGLK